MTCYSSVKVEALGVDQTCSKCEVAKPLSAFHKRAASRNGHSGTCRDCKSTAYRAYYEANRERMNAASMEYYRANKKALNEKRRDYTRAWRQASPTFREQQRAYRSKMRAQYLEHTRRRRAMIRGASSGRVTPAQLEGKLAYWGWRCWMCKGEPSQWDHVKPVSKGGPHILANLRPACGPCNAKKRATWPLVEIQSDYIVV